MESSYLHIKEQVRHKPTLICYRISKNGDDHQDQSPFNVNAYKEEEKDSKKGYKDWLK